MIFSVAPKVEPRCSVDTEERFPKREKAEIKMEYGHTDDVIGEPVVQDFTPLHIMSE